VSCREGLHPGVWRGRCPTCNSEANKKWKAANAERNKANVVRFTLLQRHEIKKYRREYYWAHREKELENRRRYCEKHRAEERDRTRARRRRGTLEWWLSEVS
jgi:hypothetical protein